MAKKKIPQLDAVLIRPGGLPEPRRIDRTLEALQAEVGGDIEALVLGRDLAAYLDEDGKAKGLPYNAVATGLAKAFRLLAFDDAIVGPLLIVGAPAANDAEGHDRSVPKEALKFFAQLYQFLGAFDPDGYVR